MRDFLVTEAAADSFVWVSEFVVVEERGHQPLLGEGNRHAGRVAGNPAATPLLGDVGCRAGAARRIEDQIARIGGHEDAALDYFLRGLHNVDFLFEPAPC